MSYLFFKTFNSREDDEAHKVLFVTSFLFLLPDLCCQLERGRTFLLSFGYGFYTLKGKHTRAQKGEEEEEEEEEGKV